MHLLYMYCFFVGKDEFGKILSKKATEAGVNVNYLIHEKEPTGTCAVCITGKHRYSLHCLLLMYTLSKVSFDSSLSPPKKDRWEDLQCTVHLIWKYIFYLVPD